MGKVSETEDRISMRKSAGFLDLIYPKHQVDFVRTKATRTAPQIFAIFCAHRHHLHGHSDSNKQSLARCAVRGNVASRPKGSRSMAYGRGRSRSHAAALFRGPPNPIDRSVGFVWHLPTFPAGLPSQNGFASRYVWQDLHLQRNECNAG